MHSTSSFLVLPADIGANLIDPMFSGHYNDKDYHPPDLDAVLHRAFAAGVEKLIVTAGSLAEARAALALARTHGTSPESLSSYLAFPGPAVRPTRHFCRTHHRCLPTTVVCVDRLFCTVGVHPTRCGEFEAHAEGPDAYLAALQAVLEEGRAEGKVVALGELGLDYERLQFCDAETQRRYFRMQLRLARSSGLPLFLHLRGAADDFLSIIGEHAGEQVGGCAGCGALGLPVHSCSLQNTLLPPLLGLPARAQVTSGLGWSIRLTAPPPSCSGCCSSRSSASASMVAACGPQTTWK